MTATSAEDYPQTQYFQACRGVFEGGGCRGAAHIGAYDAAVKCGVTFSEVAGTSAGSIIAALIGGGATPEFLLKECAALRFSSLLAKPKNRISPIFGWRRINQVASSPLKLLSQETRLLRKIFLVSGAAYSSERLENWLDDLLGKLLPDATRPIRFHDLILPTSIVAGDLSGKRYKLWSNQHTPGEKVAMAVRSSCSIPLFFEPVESGNDFLVDGGILSNLPTFAFDDDHVTTRSLGGRILAFRLKSAEEFGTQWSLRWLLRRLIDTVISGATELQSELQPRISVVEINTGTVSSTDFDISQENVDFLLSEGRDAVKQFVRNEHDKLSEHLQSDLARSGEDELFDDVVREMAIPGRRLLVSCDDTRWFWRLFPSVLHWLFNGAAVDILTRPLAGDSTDVHRERQRRTFLEKMGARIECTESLPPRCFVINRKDDRHDAAFIRNISASAHAPDSVVYVGVKHRIMIGIIRDRILTHFRGDSKRPQLELRQCSPDRIISRLKDGVHQYADVNVTIEQQEIPLRTNDDRERLRLIVRLIRTFKYRQIAYLEALYRRAGIPFCAPAEIRANDEVVSVITPPVLEQWGDHLVAIEGNTRLYHCSRANANTLCCLIASGVSAALPGNPVALKRALLTTSDVDRTERIQGFNYDSFRSIEGAVRPTEKGDET